MIRLDAATVLLQWATGGLLFLWVTTRRRQVGIGYGWLLRSVYSVMAVGAAVVGRSVHPDAARDSAALVTAAAAGVALAVSVTRRRAGVAGERARQERRRARVDAMLAGSPSPSPSPELAGSPSPSPELAGTTSPSPSVRDRRRRLRREPAGLTEAAGLAGEAALTGRKEFPPALDLVAPSVGAVGLVAAGLAAGGPHGLAVVRTLVGAGFLGVVSDAMLLGHWYLVQPGLGRAPLNELTRDFALVWPVEVAVLVWPTGMVDVFSGRVNDGWHGILGWFWAACAVTTIALAFVTRAALKERAYSAVMAATGLLYLAILTAFGTDLVARAVLAR